MVIRRYYFCNSITIIKSKSIINNFILFIIYFVALRVCDYEPSSEELQLMENFEALVARENIEENALLFIAGYVAHRFRNIHPELGTPTRNLPMIPNNWLFFLFRRNCIYPSKSFQETAEIMNNEFDKFHRNFFNKKIKIFDKLTNIVCKKINYKFPEKVISGLVRTRTYIRLRNINKQIVVNNLKK